MSRLFDRTASVTITGNGEARTITDLRIMFSARKSRGGTPNMLTVQIYNPNASTRQAALDTSATVELSAGYAGENILVSRAEIDFAIVDRVPPDIVLDIEAQEGLRKLRETTISVSHASGSSVQTVLDEIVGRLGIDVRPIEADLSAALRGGFAHVGKASRALDDLMARVRGSWSIQNGELLILPKTGQVQSGEVFVLSPQSGLVASPVPVEEQTSSDRQDTEPRIGYRVTSLLNASIEPGDVVEIQAQDVEGFFAVDEVTHRGDTRGQEWYSDMICYEAAT